MVQRHRSRVGFTTVELLVVIAILAILVALTMAGVQSARQSAARKATEAVLYETQAALEDQVKFVVDGVRKERANRSQDFRDLIAYCDGDEERTEALLAYCRMKQNFPQSFAELGPTGTNAVMFTMGTAPVVPFRRPQTFNQFAGLGGGTPEQQSAVLLYAGLVERTLGTGGAALDEAKGSVMTVNLNGDRKVFKDGYGNPVSFVRSAEATDMQGSGKVDPLDPHRKLAGNWTNKNTAQTTLGVTFGTTVKMPSVYSGGKDGARFPDINASSDDLYGYRLRQQGAKGTK